MLLLRIDSCSDIDGLLLLFGFLFLVWLRKKLIFKDPLEQARTLIVKEGLCPFLLLRWLCCFEGGGEQIEELNDIICTLWQDETRKILKPKSHNGKGRYCSIIFIHRISNAEMRVDIC